MINCAGACLSTIFLHVDGEQTQISNIDTNINNTNNNINLSVSPRSCRCYFSTTKGINHHTSSTFTISLDVLTLVSGTRLSRDEQMNNRCCETCLPQGYSPLVCTVAVTTSPH